MQWHIVCNVSCQHVKGGDCRNPGACWPISLVKLLGSMSSKKYCLENIRWKTTQFSPNPHLYTPGRQKSVGWARERNRVQTTGLLNGFAAAGLAGTLGLERSFRIVPSWVGMVRPLYPLIDPLLGVNSSSNCPYLRQTLRNLVAKGFLC